VEIINSLLSGTAAGYDNIPIFALKNSVSVISEAIAHIINLSISSCIVPDLMKIIARVIPLFKSGDHRHFQNYRPVLVLPIWSKLLERVVFKRITNYIDKPSLLSDNQYGFRKKKHSKSLALMLLNRLSVTEISTKREPLGGNLATIGRYIRICEIRQIEK
jgi:hypothetical protein